MPAVSDSILLSVKKTLGIDPSYTVFDVDILMHINSTLATFDQIAGAPPAVVGVDPAAYYNSLVVTDENNLWTQILGDDAGAPRYEFVKTWLYLRVRMLFDPPQTSYSQTAMKEQIAELDFRINVLRESDFWTNPNPPVEAP